MATASPPGDPGTRPPELPSRRGAARRTLLLGVVATLVTLLALAAAAMSAAGRAGDDAAGPALPAAGVPLQQRRPAGERFALPGRTVDGFGGGPAVDLAELRGTPLVVNFWATWCAPCVKEMPDFQRVARQAGRRVTFLGVNVQDAPRNAEPFAAELGITYRLASDPRGELYREVGAFGMPTTLFVRPDGTVVYRHTGPLDVDELRQLLRDELAVDLRG